MQFSMCVLYTFSFSVSSSLLFLFVRFNSGSSGSEIAKDASRVVTSVHLVNWPMKLKERLAGREEGELKTAGNWMVS